jgi:hypothetical protein
MNKLFHLHLSPKEYRIEIFVSGNDEVHTTIIFSGNINASHKIPNFIIDKFDLNLAIAPSLKDEELGYGDIIQYHAAGQISKSMIIGQCYFHPRSLGVGRDELDRNVSINVFLTQTMFERCLDQANTISRISLALAGDLPEDSKAAITVFSCSTITKPIV